MIFAPLELFLTSIFVWLISAFVSFYAYGHLAVSNVILISWVDYKHGDDVYSGPWYDFLVTRGYYWLPGRTGLMFASWLVSLTLATTGAAYSDVYYGPVLLGTISHNLYTAALVCTFMSMFFFRCWFSYYMGGKMGHIMLSFVFVLVSWGCSLAGLVIIGLNSRTAGWNTQIALSVGTGIAACLILFIIAGVTLACWLSFKYSIALVIEAVEAKRMDGMYLRHYHPIDTFQERGLSKMTVKKNVSSTKSVNYTKGNGQSF